MMTVDENKKDPRHHDEELGACMVPCFLCSVLRERLLMILPSLSIPIR